MTYREFLKLHKGGDFTLKEIKDLWKRYKIGTYDPVGGKRAKSMPRPKTQEQAARLQQLLSHGRGSADIGSFIEAETPRQRKKRLAREIDLPGQGYPIGKPLRNPATKELLIALLVGGIIGHSMKK